jgi:hypothetical protein
VSNEILVDDRSAIKPQRTPGGPRFGIGYPVLWNKYFGLTPRHEADQSHPADLRETVVVGIRLIPDDFEEDDGSYTTVYPKGWEYSLARPHMAGAGFVWVTEAELLAARYQPAAKVAMTDGTFDIPTVDEMFPREVTRG